MAPRRQTPILLLTGFLGAGKTSLLRQWLQDDAFAHSLILVNEIGEVGLDQQMIAPMAGDAVLLENGCICCSSSGDLVAVLEQLFYDRLHRKIPDFKRVIIETTGLAMPQSIVSILAQSTLLRERYCAPLVLTTVDALNFAEQAKRHPEIDAQIEMANAFIITKTDLAATTSITDLRRDLTKMNPAAPQYLRAGIDIVQQIDDLLSQAQDWGAAIFKQEIPQHSKNLSTSFAALPNDLTESALRAALHALLQKNSASILRVKGCVSLHGEAHFIQADAQSITFEKAPTKPEKLGMTIISQGISALDLTQSLKAQLIYKPL